MAQDSRRTTFDAGAVRFVVQHELWDGNVEDPADQGVAILVTGQVGGEETTLLRFNGCDLERSYVYGPETGHKRCRMDPTGDGNPIGWAVKQLRHKLPAMLRAAGAAELAIHVLADLAGAPGRTYTAETAWLAFDCFRQASHYHYGPRNKTHRIFWDKTLVPAPLGWTLAPCKRGKLRDMLERAGYPGVAADDDQDVVDAILPALERRARDMDAQPLPADPTPTLVAR